MNKLYNKKVKQKISKANKGSNHGMWKGGRQKTWHGYVLIHCPGHPYRDKRGQGYVMEHRLVMEKHLGRYLKPAERVHHINGIKTDNRIENLRWFPNEAEHQRLHGTINGKNRLHKTLR